jgi:hypothetical protein
MPGVPVTCGDYRVLTTNAHGLRVQRAPGISLRPLSLLGERFINDSDASRREIVKSCSCNTPSCKTPAGMARNPHFERLFVAPGLVFLHLIRFHCSSS